MDLPRIPFGSQYYRAPTPVPEDWTRDIKQMRDIGFNTIKIWAQWRWSNPAEGEYYFDDLDQIMDLAAENDLKVVINAIFDVAPAWFLQKYPDSLMKSLDGRTLHPTASEARQIGGVMGPCFHHHPGIESRKQFLHQTVSRYKDHPALALWDLWNEPELTCSLWRETCLENIACYCPESEKQFKLWLENKYRSIEKLNRVWGRNYRSFELVELPRLARTFNDMIDFRLFFADTLTDELAMRARTVKELDTQHPVMVHTVPIPHFNIVTCSSDDYQLAKHCDMFGNSLGSHPLAAAAARSNAPGKPVINAEIHFHSGTPFTRTHQPTFGEFRKHLLVPLARGIKGFLFWQYRPERLGLESPMWGLTDLAGNPTEKTDFCKTLAQILKQNAPLISAAKCEQPRIAVVNGKENQIFDFCDNHTIDRFYHSVHGAFNALYRSGHLVDIISTDQILDNDIDRYDVIYYPWPYYIRQKVADKLKDWTTAGGLLISETSFASITDRDCLHSTTIPGLGFHEVFGLTQKDVLTASLYLSSYSQKWGRKNLEKNLWALKIQKTLSRVKTSDHPTGYFYREALNPTSAEVLATFEDGAPAITKNQFGKGTAVMIGTLLAHTCSENQNPSSELLLTSLVELAPVTPSIQTDNRDIRADIICTPDNQALLVLVNDSKSPIQTTITFPAKSLTAKSLQNLLTAENIPLTKKSDTLHAKIKIEPNSADLYKTT